MPHPALALRVISLDDSAERRALVRENLAGFALPWAFLDGSRAADASDLTVDPAGQRMRFGRELTQGEVGCFKSHMRALAEFDADPALDWLLVMEDDVWLDPAFPYGALATWLDDHRIGFLRLFAREWRRAWPRFHFGERQVLYLATDPFGTQGYLISRSAAQGFRSRVRRVVRPIDDEFGRFWENGLDNHLLFPFPMVERHGASTLNTARSDAGQMRATPGLRRKLARAKDYAAKRLYLAWRLSPFARDRIRHSKR